MKKLRSKPATAILLGILILAALALVMRSRLKQAEARSSLQDRKVEIPTPVRTISVKEGSIRQWVSGTGNARAVKREFLVFESQGRVTFIRQIDGRTIQEGDMVRGPTSIDPNGELLARLDDKDQQAAVAIANAALNETQEQEKVSEAMFKQAQARLDFAKKRFEREGELLKADATPRESYEQAQTDHVEAQLAADVAKAQRVASQAGVAAARAKVTQAQIELEKTRIYSPIDGVIAYKNLKVGWQFSQKNVRTESEEILLNSIPFVVIDPSEFEISVDVPSRDSINVESGQMVEIHTLREKKIAADAMIAGEVLSVNPAINPGDRSTRVRIRTETGAEHLRDGEYVQCRILVSEKSNVISIPFNAAVIQDRQMSTFVVNSDNRVERRTLRLGIRSEDQYEIVEGLKSGERIVTEGRFDLYDGALVEVLPLQGRTSLD
jgi:RND family efflux transporter MFP subunit